MYGYYREMLHVNPLKVKGLMIYSKVLLLVEIS